MELCEASRHPVLALGRSGSLPPKGSQRARIKSHPPSVSLQLPTCNDSIPSPIQINNSLQRSTVSPRKGVLSAACVGMCKVFWTIEADIEDDHKLFITGDLVTLGCWDINMAVPLFPSKENACLWRTEVEIPSGMHFKYNYFVKRDDQLSHGIVWRPGPEFSLSVPMANMQSEVIVVRDMWLNKPCLTPSISCWTSWLHEAMYVTEEVENVGHYLPRGKKKMVQRSKMNEASAGEISVADILNEEVVLSVEKDAKSGADPRNAFCELQQPVEEPWLHRSTLSFASDFSLVSKACDHLDKKNDARTLKDLEKETEKIEDVDEHKVAPDKGSVSTVILINSSVCTMQRIAILEDAKLVELLLEPVKNNVQCDSVYLGVVTKLVPHMGGAFVDIGISRPSLMDIKPNREPFVYPPFDTLTIGQELNGSINTEQVTSEHEQNLTDDENVADEFLVDDHVEESTDSTHLMHANIDKREFEDSLYDINNDDGTEADLDVFYPENGHHMQIENVETPYPSNLEGPDSSELSVLLQDPADSAVKRSRGNKWARVRKGTKIIVQVVKEGLGTKGPALSAYPNLKSRFWILIARCDRIGVSKKIIGAERTRLRVIAKTLQPTGFGLTVRTVAAGHSLEELQKDLQGLLSTWKGIIEHAKSAALAADEGVEGAVPVILHRAMGQTLSVVQDYFNDKVKSMIVDSHRTYHEVSNYLQEIAPDLCDRVVLYNKRTPLFDEYGIEEEINNILSKRVPLSNGGSLVIEQTEALVSIDVNGGQSMLGQCTSQEKAVLEVNLSAAKQIARELRLRDVGGIIVVDFIDMIDEANKRLVYEEVKKAVERDKSMVKVSELSRHGLMEITRKRVRPSVSFLISEPCPCCQGTGRVEALETSFSRIEHEICRLLAASGHKSDPENANSWPRFVLKVDRYMCNYLTSGKKTKLAFLSSSLKVWIFLKVARGFPRGAFELKPYLDDKTNEENPAIISKLHSAEARSYIPNSKLTLFPVKKWKSRGK